MWPRSGDRVVRNPAKMDMEPRVGNSVGVVSWRFEDDDLEVVVRWYGTYESSEFVSDLSPA